MKVFEVQAHWDHEAGLWWADSKDVKGLAAEAETIAGLADEVREIIPDLLELNNQAQIGETVTFKLVARASEDLCVA